MRLGLVTSIVRYPRLQPHHPLHISLACKHRSRCRGAAISQQHFDDWDCSQDCMRNCRINRSTNTTSAMRRSQPVQQLDDTSNIAQALHPHFNMPLRLEHLLLYKYSQP
jgi:hypothetical protein